MLAPAIAVVGPPNSGKTSLLHLLDEALARHPGRPRAYVLQGNPDGTGRYLHYAAGLRKRLRGRVKGAWTDRTAGTILSWIESCRAWLEVVIVDFGGRHTHRNERLLAACTHYLVLGREVTAEEAQGPGGSMESWTAACEAAGLTPLARVRSVVGVGEPAVKLRRGPLLATFRADAVAPGDATNRVVVGAIVGELLRIRLRRPPPDYLDLLAPTRWRVADLVDLRGLLPRLVGLARRGERIILGGKAPLWVYCAAACRALEQNPGVELGVFDPKLGLPVSVPVRIRGPAARLLRENLAISWRSAPRARCTFLEIDKIATDRMLPVECCLRVDHAPLPEGAVPSGAIALSGPVPMWLHLTYLRWLLRRAPGRALGAVDAATESVVFVHGRRAPRSLRCRLAGWPLRRRAVEAQASKRMSGPP